MRIRTIGVVSLAAAVALFVGVDSAQAKTGKKHCTTKGHCAKKSHHCCKSSHCCHGNDAGSVLMKKGNCKTELELMKKAGMCSTMHGKGPITVFAPTDEAYAKLGKARVADISGDPKKLSALVKYHVLNRKVNAGDIKAGGSLVTSEGESLMTNSKDGKAEVDGCLVIEQDIPCSNGVIHLLDFVPVPERGK
ncbi:MAG: fasciclin domain-containing protein [Candidatus Obscuribacterales bacterium]|nr:fasciclin domain-containing protein [Candidatus Obscuribacterales bacterium]